jgi:hypothetical protein
MGVVSSASAIIEANKKDNASYRRIKHRILLTNRLSLKKALQKQNNKPLPGIGTRLVDLLMGAKNNGERDSLLRKKRVDKINNINDDVPLKNQINASMAPDVDLRKLMVALNVAAKNSNALIKSNPQNKDLSAQIKIGR